MRFPLLFGAVLLALSSVPVYASECLPGYSMPEVQAALDGYGAKYRVLAPEEMDYFLTEVAPLFVTIAPEVEVSRIIVAQMGDKMAFGLEIDGCVSDPIMMVGAPVQPAPAFQSPALKSPKAEIQS